MALFAALLLIVSAVPVLAAEPSSQPPEELISPPASLQAQAEWLPDASEVQGGIETARLEEAARKRELEGPEASREREESRDAFADLNAAEAQDLLPIFFADQLAKLNADPARFLGDAEIVRTAGPTAATVREDGDGALLDAGIPVRTEDEDGDLRKVDLTLEATAGGFETANALSTVRIGASAAEPIEVGEEGISISQVGAAGSSASQRFGAQNVFHFESLADTDTLVSPTATGVEIFNLLRSERSPEAFRFDIELPKGAELRPDGRGGATVEREGETIAAIPFPTAVDAQGTDVPVDLAIEGSSIVVRVDHREGDYAMPILLDPILEDWVNSSTSWHNGHNLQALSNGSWQWTSVPSGKIWVSTSCMYTCWGSGRGLYTSAPSGNYGANVYSHWSYSAPNMGSYVSKAWLIPFWRDDHGCSKSQYGQPHDYVGFWGDSQWNLVHANQAIDVGSYANESWGRAFIVGLHTGGGVNIPCWRDLYVGGAAVWLDDWEWPSVSASVSGVPPGWFGGSQEITVSASVSDSGLGVRLVKLNAGGRGVIGEDHVGYCTGLYANRCPNTRNSQFHLTGASFAEGVTGSSVSVEDPTGKAAAGGYFQTKADDSPPEVTLDGQLAEVTEDDEGATEGDAKVEKLRLPVYNLKIEAKDGSNASDQTRRSGVENIEILLDGVKREVPWSAQSATEDSRPMTQTYLLELSKLQTAGLHKLEVKVRDQVGNVRERTLEFEYFPATGMKDEYLMHYFPLPDGQGNEAEEEHPVRPELAVNVMNGNLVYRQRDVEVKGPAVDLELERYYNSQLPEAEDTEWGDGWTLAQTPDLKPLDTGGSPAADEAELLEASGAIEEGVELPAEVGQESFDPALQATLTKRAGGGYELSDATGESATSVVFDETGQVEARLTDGHAKVDYSYEGGELAEIAIEDPGSAAYPPGEPFGVPDPPVLAYADSFGATGTGNSQFDHPGDVAIAPDGDIWVADTDNDRVQHFDSDGDYVGQFGTSGAGNGQLNRPTGVAVNAAGNIGVIDSLNHRLQVFSEAGAFLAKVGTFGGAGGQFDTPVDLVADSEGNTWVSDLGNGRVQKLGKGAAFLKAAGTSGPGELSEPMGIDVGPDDEVFVADRDQNRIVVFDSAGEYQRAFGTAGDGDGELDRPAAVEVDAQGNVWVGDTGNHRIQQFDLQGNYVGQLGGEGSGLGEMDLAAPMGIVTDAVGAIWLTDPGNAQVQVWERDQHRPLYTDSFGEAGTGDGQLDHPGDVAIAPDGDIWVADTDNDRVQHFDSDGDYIGQFGSSGTGNGQFQHPVAIEVDAAGYVWVADSVSNRLQKFDDQGQFLSKGGVYGVGNGQVDAPEGISFDAKGDLWVADTGNQRIQKFSLSAGFLRAAGTQGPGDLTKPTGIDTGPEDEVFVADWAQSRIVVFDADGEYLRHFGGEGDGSGELLHPVDVEVDSQGNVWVAEEGSDRIQRFDLQGNYLAQFGGEGSGEEEMELSGPVGIATDSEGSVWLTDAGNDRMQRWEEPAAPPADAELLSDDPEVEVEVADGLVAGVEGDQAGEHTYEHDDGFLVSHDGPLGETLYEKNAAGLLLKVTLPNGTWASIEYFADNRVKSVEIKLAGEPSSKTTTFEYQDAPQRRTVVDPPDTPKVTYEIGADGSVFKWWNAAQPPTFDSLGGTLWDHREEDGGLWAGDHQLEIQAFSAEPGIASIQVIANGNQLVHETTCETESSETECEVLKTQWVVNTGQLTPGYLELEVIATDHAEGSISERFWVDIPEPPPPPAPGTPIPPTFADILSFRNEYGLEKVFPVANEIERNERIFNLIKAWNEGDPVARASWERWGVPLRPQDVAEMEYREWYMSVNIPLIEEWGENNRPNSFAGYYLDHRKGGVLHVGFTQDQTSSLTELIQHVPLVAIDRIAIYPATPSNSRMSLAGTMEQIEDIWSKDAGLDQVVMSIGVDESKNTVEVTGTDVAQIEDKLKNSLGNQVPIRVLSEGAGELYAGRNRVQGPMRAGDRILGESSACTAGFGAYDEVGQKANGQQKHAHFLLTAGHCAGVGELFYRTSEPGNSPNNFQKIGHVARTGLPKGGQHYETDGSAIKLRTSDLAPHHIYRNGENARPVDPAHAAKHGETLCFSGMRTNEIRCGEMIGVRVRQTPFPGRQLFIITRFAGLPGDSGSPVWNPRTNHSIGLVAGGPNGTGLVKDWVTPLVRPRGFDQEKVPGILNAPGMDSLSLITGG